MTTIIWDGENLASDSLCVNGHIRSGFVTKIARAPNGELAGAAGGAGYNRAFLAWVTGGRQGDAPKPESNDGWRDLGFIVLLNGEIEQHEPEGVNIIRAPAYAAGSGRDIARAAVMAGADARRAVEIAIGMDVYSGGEITVLRREV